MMTNRIEVFLLQAGKIFLLIKPKKENITLKISVVDLVRIRNVGTVFTRVSDPDPDWIRIQSGQWIRIRNRIQEGKNDPRK
jgi:hypothetical protein